MLNAEMDVHLGGETEQDGGNHRNGSSRKTVLSDDGELVLSIPRDRHGRFDPRPDPRKSSLILPDQGGIEAAVSVSGNRQHQLAVVAEYRLPARPLGVSEILCVSYCR